MNLVMPKPAGFNTWGATSRTAYYRWWIEDNRAMIDRLQSDGIALKRDSDPRAYQEGCHLLRRFWVLKKRAARYARRAAALERRMRR